MLDTAGALGFGIAMLTAHAKVGERLPASRKQTAKLVGTALRELQSRWSGQRVAALTTAEGKRPADLRKDRAFRAIAGWKDSRCSRRRIRSRSAQRRSTSTCSPAA